MHLYQLFDAGAEFVLDALKRLADYIIHAFREHCDLGTFGYGSHGKSVKEGWTRKASAIAQLNTTLCPGITSGRQAVMVPPTFYLNLAGAQNFDGGISFLHAGGACNTLDAGAP